MAPDWQPVLNTHSEALGNGGTSLLEVVSILTYVGAEVAIANHGELRLALLLPTVCYTCII